MLCFALFCAIAHPHLSIQVLDRDHVRRKSTTRLSALLFPCMTFFFSKLSTFQAAPFIYLGV
ncbi:hypothetical protein BD289DRAFT_443273 [Coniella lustricola]|uniref:Uncharacterized protein n=1 Tax=Coniella lustricola TaxID=2025994 RepID=A0A2T2ZXD2_9PEZI|nr:hypothetical protein BD289DRAFT_443273 [Coniella lustricola]